MLACQSGWSSSSRLVPIAVSSSWRSYKKHLVNRPNLAQAQDVNTIDRMLSRATSPTAAALPVLKHLSALNPRQTTGTLERLIRMPWLQGHRMGMGRRPGYRNLAWGAEEQEAQRSIIGALHGRLVTVIKDCSQKELDAGLWGLAMATRLGIRNPDLDQLLAPRLYGWLRFGRSHVRADDARTLSLAAWWLSASGMGRDTDVMQHIAARVSKILAGPRQPLPLAKAHSGRVGQDAAGQGASSLSLRSSSTAMALMISQPGASSESAALIDHRSICRLAWSFSVAQRRDAERQEGDEGRKRDGEERRRDDVFWQRLCTQATLAIEALLQGHDPSRGPLQAKVQYLYRTVQGWTKLPEPRPYRPSKYLRFNGPTLVVDSFGLGSAASLLTSLVRAGRKDDALLSAIERLVVATLPQPHTRTRARPVEGGGASTRGSGKAGGSLVSLSSSPPRAQLGTVNELGSVGGGSHAAVLPGTSGGLVAAARGRVVPADPSRLPLWQAGDMPSLKAGTARLKVAGASPFPCLSPRVAGQILRGFYDLRRKSPAVAAAVWFNADLSQFNLNEVCALFRMALRLGLKDEDTGGSVSRVLAYILPLADSMPDRVVTRLAIAAARAGCPYEPGTPLALLWGRTGNAGLLTAGAGVPPPVE